MGGIVKGIKKAFKAVTHFVKKYWKVIVIAAAIFFTCGIAAGAFVPAATATEAGVVGGVEAGAGFSAMAAGAATATEAGVATAAAGTAATAAAVTLPTVSVTAAAAGGSMAGMVAGGAAALGGAALAASGSGGADDQQMQSPEMQKPDFLNTEDVTNVGDVNNSVMSKTMPVDDVTTQMMENGANPAGSSLVDKTTGAIKGFWGGMSTGEKMMFASTAFSAISGALKQPTRAEEGLWPGGAYFGMDEKGHKTDLAAAYKAGVTGADQQPTAPPATQATAVAPPPGQMQRGGQMQTQGPIGPGANQTVNQDVQDNNLPTASAGAASGSSLLPAAGSGAANAQRANQQGQENLSIAATRNQKFFDDLRDRLDANDRSNPGA